MLLLTAIAAIRAFFVVNSNYSIFAVLAVVVAVVVAVIIIIAIVVAIIVAIVAVAVMLQASSQQRLPYRSWQLF